MINLDYTIDGIKISDDLLNQIGIDKQNTLVAFAADTAYRYMDKYVPKSNGHFIGGEENIFIPGGMLREVVDIYSSGKDYVLDYMMPYARYQYYGQRADGSHKVKNYTTPGTGPYWDKNMLTAEGKEFYDEIQRFIDKRLK